MSRHLYLETMESRKEIHFAPVQGYTDSIYRNLHHSMFKGIDAYYTPFIRLEKGHEFRPRDLRDCDPSVNTVERLIPQVLGGEPEELRLALTMLREKGFQQADINLGCPFPMIARKGKGAGLLPFPEKVGDVLRVVERHPDVSFSVKMRLGYEEPDECLGVLPVLNVAKLACVTVHARTGRQQYKGECDRDAFRRFADACGHPVVYNGDIATPEDCERLAGCMPELHGVMIGRGLLATPWLAAEYRAGKTWGGAERYARMRLFHADLFDHYAQTLEGGEKQLLMKMKAFWEYLLPDAGRKLHKKIHKAQKTADYTDAVSRLLSGEE